jgi:uncharacterized membrane protein (DUF4010 family)
MDAVIYKQLGLAVTLGLLVGFQREWAKPHVAGIRTFALITVLGTVTALFTDVVGIWLVVAGFVAVAAMIIVGDSLTVERSEDHGLTTQAAALVMYSVGVAIGLDRMILGTIVGGGTAVLLQWKGPLHAFVKRIGEEDIRAIFQLTLIALVILPVLPNRSFDPYGVLNPFEIWLMVVLIVGVSLGGFIVYKFFGARAGTLLGGILGGVISSTATTVGYARRAKESPNLSRLAALVIVIASTVVFIRVLVEVAIVAPAVLPQIGPPIAIMMLLMAAIATRLYFVTKDRNEPVTLRGDPTQMKAAVVFGLMYAVVLFGVAAARNNFSDQALYVVAALSGLTDMDAITLSTAQMIKKERLDPHTGWHLIVVGSLSNLVFKAAAVALLGNWRLFARVAIPYGIALVGGVALLLFWP